MQFLCRQKPDVMAELTHIKIWLLNLLREFQRLKEEEQKQLGWSAKRELAKINYRIHTDAIKQNKIAIQQMKVLENIDDRKLLAE